MDQKVEKKDMKKPKKPKSRMLLVLVFLIVMLAIGYISFRGQYLELIEIGENYKTVFWQNIRYTSITILVTFVILFVSIYIANKIIKKGLTKFFTEEKKDMPKLPNKSLALIFSILVSIITSKILTKSVLFIFNTTWFGINDPIFNMDIGYYMFQKPFIELILIYIIGIAVGLTIYTALYYIIVFNTYFDGVNRETLKNSSFIKQIINCIKVIVITLAGFVLVKTQDIVFEKMLTLDNTLQTSILGAGLTSVTIKLWGYRILAVVMIVSVFLAIKYFNKNDTKKVLTYIMAVPIYLVCLFVVMLGFELIFVRTNELDKQKKYISYNIEFTKNAYNLNIEEQDLEHSGIITLEEINDNEDVIGNIAIVSEDIVKKTLEEKQTNSKYYTYNTNKIGKYNVNGKEKVVYISPREISNVSNTYDNKTYEYTHGYGAIITSAVSTDETGNVEYIQKTFDGSDQMIDISEPRIYFGLETNSIVITNSKNKTEYDYPIGTSRNAENSYKGEAGLSLNFFDRLILGMKKGNLKIAFSGEVTGDSKLLINTNILERAKKILPYIIYDEEPYQIITEEGKLVWVMDGYTTSSNYPYAEQTIITVDGIKQKINYIRNSVKVIIDSYDGTTKFYITDRTDPIVMAYRNMYPDLFVDLDESIPEGIASHIIYPEFLYNIQSEILKRYHNVKTDVLYRSNDVWDFATHTASKTLTTTGTVMEPYYTMVKTVDEENPKLGLVIPYTQYNKQNIISYLVGTYDWEYGYKLKLYKFSADSNILGPMQLDTQIEQDEEISKVISSLNVTGTRLIRNMIVVPIDNTLLYVEPIYQVMLNESQVPILKSIIVASGNKVAIGDNLKEALKSLLSQYAVNIEVQNTDSINDLIEAIIKANNNLKTSNNVGDWELVGKDIKSLQELINKLEELSEKEKEEQNKIEQNLLNNENQVNTNTNDNILE